MDNGLLLHVLGGTRRNNPFDNDPHKMQVSCQLLFHVIQLEHLFFVTESSTQPFGLWLWLCLIGQQAFYSVKLPL